MTLYRLLLRLLPASFRSEYGDEMAAIFERRWRMATSRGARGMLWAETIADVVTNAVRVQWEVLRQDLRYAVRSLRRSPGFAATAILVSALGLGATTAAFSMADHVLLRPLPFPDAHRLVKLWEDHTAAGYSRMELSPPNFLDWQRLSTSFEGMAAYTSVASNLVGDGVPERVEGVITSVELFAVLGRQAVLGRTLTVADARPDAPLVVVIGDGLWRRRFGSDPSVLGRTITMNDVAHTIVGVMPPAFQFPLRTAQFWRPLTFQEVNGDDDRNNNYLRVVARLRPGVTVEQARSDLQLVASQLQQQYPKENEDTGATVVRLRDEIAAQPRQLLFALVAAAVCVLLIACTNLANLLLSRALQRQGEMAVRTAVGASPERLVRQMLTESLVLAVCGGALGIVVANTALPLIVKLVPTVLPIAETPSLDLRMLALATTLTLATAVVFGLVPAWRSARRGQAAALAGGARTGSSRHTERFRSTLVVAEIGLSVLLLVSAGLLIQALSRIQSVDPGFKAEGVLTLRTSLPFPKYQDTPRRVAFYRQVIDDIRALAGVTDAAYTSFIPMVMRGGIWPVQGTPSSASSATPPRASLRFVTPGFFDTLGIPQSLGRDFTDADTGQSLLVAVVSQSFAREHWPDGNPIGQRFSIGLAERTVVGVVSDVRVRGLERESEPQAYLPAAQQPDGGLSFYVPQDLAVRSSIPSTALIPSIRAIIARADPQQPIANVQTLEDVVNDETAPRLVQVRVLGAFAAVALLLAAVGIHGLLAFTVAARTREIGVRLALGAEPRQILVGVLGHGLTLSVVGVLLGVIGAMGAGQMMQALLAGVSPADVPSLAGAAVLAAAMTLVGSLLPALRAMRVDPVTAIRE